MVTNELGGGSIIHMQTKLNEVLANSPEVKDYVGELRKHLIHVVCINRSWSSTAIKNEKLLTELNNLLK